MSLLRKLIHEIHRRSVWQALGIYVVASWVALQVVDVLADNFGLPDWFPALALGLLVVGLPVVVATALIQEPAPEEDGTARRVEDDPARDDTPATRARGSAEGGDGWARLFTWRNAILGGLAALALWGLVAAGWILLGDTQPRPRRDAAGEGRVIESIAVLPFADLSPEGDQQYFGDGIAEEILDALARVPGLKVAARSSSFQFKGRNPDVREVGDTLGVEAVLDGSVRKSRDSRQQAAVDHAPISCRSVAYSRSFEQRASTRSRGRGGDDGQSSLEFPRFGGQVNIEVFTPRSHASART